MSVSDLVTTPTGRQQVCVPLSGMMAVNSKGERTHPVKRTYGGYVQCNPVYDRANVLSRSEFRALALVLGQAYKTMCEKGETHVTGRTEELLCYEEQKAIAAPQCSNYLWEISACLLPLVSGIAEGARHENPERRQRVPS